MKTLAGQQKRVHDFMKECGSITSYEAFKELGVTRLSAVIFKLKKKDITIYKKKEKTENRYGEIVYFARYALKKKYLQ